jgi:SAM-dependent methyltransferase
VPADYVVDVPYARNFVAHLAPPTLRLVAALNGLQPPPEADFDYCELGSGYGDTIATLAASNPEARFVGVDFNAEHVDFARDLASRGGLGNLRFLQKDFEDLAGEDIPSFDFLVMHGVWSWVKPPKRRAILAFANAKLKPGGLLCVSYNALPGWAALEPLRRLILSHTESITGSTLDRARAGFEYVERLAEAKAGYFASHPTARSMLEVMRKGGLSYVAHEYFHAEWRPMYFADVAKEMGANGLGYAGQVPLYLNIPALALPPSMKDMGKTAGADRVAFETLKDFGVNEAFRTDVYTKGKVERSQKEMAFYFEGTPFGTMAGLGQIKRAAKLPNYTLDYAGPVYDAILGAIAERGATAMELAMRPKLVELGQPRIGGCLQNLVLGGQVVPMRPLAGETGSGKALKMASPYNEHVLSQAISGQGPLVLASPVTGTGVHLSLVDALALGLLIDVEPAERAAWVQSYAGQRTLPMSIGERVIKDAGDLVQVVLRGVEELTASGAVAKMVELGVLTRTSEGESAAPQVAS